MVSDSPQLALLRCNPIGAGHGCRLVREEIADRPEGSHKVSIRPWKGHTCLRHPRSMRQTKSCLTCAALVIAYTNAMQAVLNALFEATGLTARATPKSTWDRYKGHCVYCGQEAQWSLRTRSKLPDKQSRRNLHVGQSPQLDHWIPISLGGPPTVWNMILSCRACNISKGKQLRPYPPALIAESPALAEATQAALEWVHRAWGDCVSLPTKRWTRCESANYIAARWQTRQFSLGTRFQKLTALLDQWSPGYCDSVTPSQQTRLMTALERETARELYR